MRSLAASLLCVALGCAWLAPAVEVPPAPELSRPLAPETPDGSIEEQIGRSLPEVSYETQNPALKNPLGTDDPSVLLRRVETLEGEQRIVCEKSTGRVFGRCVFPPLEKR